MPWLHLKKWWTTKYHQSVKSNEFKEYTVEELLIEFFEDLFLEDKKELRKAEIEISGGNVRLPSYGDPLIEKWEKQIAEGKFPDLVEGFPAQERQKVREAIEKSKERKKEEGNKKVKAFIDKQKSMEEYKRIVESLEEFSDKY